jgi:hypothetical protein
MLVHEIHKGHEREKFFAFLQKQTMQVADLGKELTL